MREVTLRLPPGYRTDREDPDFVVLRDPDGCRVAVFSALGAKPESVRRAAEKDFVAKNPAAVLPAGDVLDRDVFDLLAALHVAEGRAERLAARSPGFGAVARAVGQAASAAEAAMAVWEDPPGEAGATAKRHLRAVLPLRVPGRQESPVWEGG